jgi:hypothetical protein
MILWLLSNLQTLAIGAGALLVAFFGFYAKGRLSGAAKERAKIAASEAKARDVQDEVQSDIGALSDAQVAAELARRARK